MVGFVGIVEWFLMDGREQKVGERDVRAKALSWDGEWDKARKLIFSFISTLAHGGTRCAPLTSLAARKKKPLRGEKVGFAEKKLRLWLAELP